MSKTYNERMAQRIREILPEDTEFDILADPPHWKGYIFVEHPSGAEIFVKPWVRDKRSAVTEDMVQETLRSVAYKLLPKTYYTAKWQAINREAHALWVAQTGIEL